MDILKKLQVKNQTGVFIQNAPNELKTMFDEWRRVLDVTTETPAKPMPFVLMFVKDKAQLESSRPVFYQSLDPSGLIWVAYPKKTSKTYQSDLSRDDFWQAFQDIGLAPVRQIALDDDWSALRFRVPGS